MKTIETINQSGYIYTINQLGNRSFRITFQREGYNRVNHVDHVFDTIESCEGYISLNRNSDALVDMLDYNARYQRENIRRIVVKVNRKTQPEIAEHLDKIENVQGYILDLIRKDM